LPDAVALTSLTAPGSPPLHPHPIISSRAMQTQHLAETAMFQQLPPNVRSFLFESERRVIEHCLRLLRARDLAGDHRERLIRLAKLAETHLQRLDGNQPVVSRVDR
jgi:hypothetical protein